ncbi:metal ion binding protein [Alternaria alternata]|nr:metal ion binding protein [Alternaria alternata]
MPPSLNGHGPASPASFGFSDADLTAFTRRFEHFQQFEEEKTQFLAEIVTRYEYIYQQYQALAIERERDRVWVTAWKNEKVQYEKKHNHMLREMSDNPFVTVLIDGDGMIFCDKYLGDGEQGGRRAALDLSAAVQEYVDNDCNDIPYGARIVCRIYANVRGLGDVLVRKGVYQYPSEFEKFVRGFTRGKTLFDFIDVGAGKDRADEKIIESCKLYSHDYHCRRILFGCSHDNGYARMLEECSDRPELVNKIILLEGVPFEKELVNLPYDTKKFPGIFRDTKIVFWGAPIYSGGLPPAFVPARRVDSNDSSKASVSSTGLPSRFPPPAKSPVMDSPLPSRATMMGLPRTPSTSTLASDGMVAATKPVLPMNWAAKVAASPPPVNHSSPTYKPANREEVIARNRAGQRIDPPCKDYDKIEVDRVKKIKMCNVHFLRNECPYEKNCTHLHAYKPTESEVATLRLVARMAPCSNGSGCQDIRCIYGHCCPAPHKTHHIKGTKNCIFGDSCKFPIELHDIDTNVVKTLVIR